MQLISTILPLLLASTLSLALPVTKTKRSASTVLSDIATISSDVATLTSDAASYTGGLFQSLALAITVDNLESAITTATSDTTSSTAFSSTDSDSILAAITTLTPKIVTLLSDLDAIVCYS
jgi:chemotaxis signal transduction protein